MLSVKKVASAIRKGSRARLPDGHGLYLVVRTARNASYQFRYERDGRERWLGLGPHRVIGLAGARERARAARLQLLDGFDPIDQRKSVRAEAAVAVAKAMSFEAAMRGYFETHAAKWRNKKSRDSFLGPLERYALPVLGSLPVNGVNVALVLRVVEPLWATKAITAGRLRGSIEAILDWARARGLRSDNPATWDIIGQILPPPRRLRKVEHLSAMPHDALPAFMAQLRACPGTAARALEFTIMTAVRTNEVLGARWDEVDLPNAIWTVPPQRTKGGKQHRVPLSTAAIKVLTELPREAGNEFVFPGDRAGRGLSPMAMLSILRHLGRTETAHGMRATFRTWCSEATNFPREIAEQALGHVVGSQVERSYARSDVFEKRRKLMESWAAHVARPSTAMGEIVPIRAAAS
jgi:integrase